jgi:hypothetical protein
MSGRQQLDPLRRAPKQGHTKLSLQVPDLPAERGLGDV